MTLQEFLRFIDDEEQYCFLEIDDGADEGDYEYETFWLSDFRSNMSKANSMKDYIVTGFKIEYDSNLVIEVRKA